MTERTPPFEAASAELEALRSKVRALGEPVSGLAALSEKYQLLCALRDGEPGRTIERRDAMRKIAVRFPGALREWDEASASDLQERRRVVDALCARVAAAGDSDGAARAIAEAPGWLRYGLELHPLLVEILRAKRWVAAEVARGVERAELSARFRDRHPTLELADIAAPPGGQVTRLAYEAIAASHGVAAADVKAALFEFESQAEADGGAGIPD